MWHRVGDVFVAFAVAGAGAAENRIARSANAADKSAIGEPTVTAACKSRSGTESEFRTAA